MDVVFIVSTSIYTIRLYRTVFLSIVVSMDVFIILMQRPFRGTQPIEVIYN